MLQLGISREGNDDDGASSSGSSDWHASEIAGQDSDDGAPPPPPLAPHPEEMEDPVLRRAATANTTFDTKRGPNANSINDDTLHTSAETDDDAAESDEHDATAGSVGYEVALTKRGSTGVAVPELCGAESRLDYDNNEESKAGATRWENIRGSGGNKNFRESLCNKRIVLLSLLLLLALGAVGAGVGYVLSSKRSRSSSGSEASNEAENFPHSDSLASNEADGSPVSKPGDDKADETPSPTPVPTTFELASAPTFRAITKPEQTYATFSFVVLGDIPYSEEEGALLEAQLYQLGIDKRGNPNIDDLFAVHVGDIMSGSESRSNRCSRDEYSFVEAILTKVSPVPIFLQVGDNDWTECEDPDEGWKYWTQSFFDLDKRWAAHQNLTYSASTSDGVSSAQMARADVPRAMSPYQFTGMVQRQEKRKENFVFMHERVLFLGINMIYDVYSTSEREERMEDNKEFVREQLGLRSDLELRAVILFGHAWYDDFFDDLKEELTVGLEGTPVVYFHGNGHEWYFDDEYYGNENPFYVMQVDNGAAAPPLKITVYGDDRSYMDEGDREDANDELIDGFIGVDRQGGTDQGHHIHIGAGAPFLIFLGDEICSEDEPCGMCEGDCDSDDDCAEDLVCIFRDEFESVAGCDDPIVMLEGWDYCARG